ncbi:hypothetical protein PW52_14620 [Tamlana sedimentorum]|uniref:Phosphatidate cytidylyltransferase n=1 Tax=Neotamlana sedimentorum TaxID=1435349 RepID=A0A0D7W3K7_9FLAO|nr:hypothetical protein [Tamlana sedimentorum]KJD33273.1 hypothetical protein PW52_14620 [Tamlana sedimentorum]
MMLNNQQTLVVSGILACGFFVCGLLDILDNFIVLTVLTLLFFAIVINVFRSGFKNQNENLEE